MKKFLLIRTAKNGKAVEGHIDLEFDKDVIRCHTLENADYIIPAGDYEIDMTHSPKFNKFLPELLNVQNRSGIRIHSGIIPEHTRGCILLSPWAMNFAIPCINREVLRDKEHKPILSIIDDYGKQEEI